MTKNLERALATAKSIGETFDRPDDDWTSVALLYNKKGKSMVVHFAHANEEEKRLTYLAVLPALMRKFKARSVVMVNSAWFREGTDEEFKTGLYTRERPSESPDREEVLMLSEISAVSTYGLLIPILRYPDRPPQLGEPLVDAEDTVLTGFVADNVRRALQAILLEQRD